MPRPDVESEVVKLLSYRYELAERVYFHHAKNAASVMIGRAFQELGLNQATVESPYDACGCQSVVRPRWCADHGRPVASDPRESGARGRARSHTDR